MTRYHDAVLFVLLAALWGTAFVAIKAGLEFFPPVLFAAIRYELAGVVVLAYAAWAVDDWLPSGRQWLLVAPGAVLMIGGYHAFLFVGQQGTTSATAAVLVGLSPVLTAGFARVFLPGERLTTAGVAGLCLGLLGVAVLSGLFDVTAFGLLLSGVPLGEVLDAAFPQRVLGDEVVPELLVFAAAASFALGSVLTRWVDAELPTESMQAWSMLLGAVLLHLVSVALPGESLAAVEWAPAALWALAYLVVGASVVGFLIYFVLLERIGPTELNLVSYVVPPFAAVAGWVVLGEAVDAATVVGFLAILAGFALVKRRALADEMARVRDRGDPGGSAVEDREG